MDFEIVDADGHVYEPDAELFTYLEPPYAGRGTVRGFPLWPTIDGFQRGAIHARLGIHETFRTDARTWLDLLDRSGITRTVLYPTLGLACGLIRDADWAVALARAYNNWLAERYLRVSPRLCGMAIVPLQSSDAAVHELRRAVTELHMLGAVLPAVKHGPLLGQPDFDPLYAEAERLGCALAVHGGPSQGLCLEGLEHFAQVHTLSHPFAQMLQMTSIIMNGVLDRFPDLRLAFLEAGAGWVPFMMDRMDRSYAARRYPEYVGCVRQQPSRYLRHANVYVSAEPGESTLPYVVTVLGAERLLFGSDFPHEVNASRCREEIASLVERPDLTPEAKRNILGGNARRFYRLEAGRG